MGKMKQTAKVISQEILADGIYSMWIQTDGIAVQAKQGQFIAVYCNDGTKILPRPISLCEVDKENDRLRIVYRVVGGGTTEFSTYEAGDDIEIMGPLGNGFALEEKSAILVAGGIGIPPMVQLARALKESGVEKISIVVGYRNEDTFLVKELESLGTVYLATEDGSLGTKGNVVDAIKANALDLDAVMYACGPTPMLRALKNLALEHDMRCYLSMEEKMACGIGACLACVCKSKEVDGHSHVHNKRICKDGPVFECREIEL